MTPWHRAPAIAAVLALLAGCEGCEPIEVTFPVADDDDATEPPDDDSADDDSAEPHHVAPAIEIVAVEPPADEMMAGLVTVSLALFDPDSATVTVEVTWSAQGPDGPFSPATLEGEPGSEATFVVDGAPPIEGEPGSIAWNTLADVPMSAVGAALQLCPVDGEGTDGACVVLSGLLVVNEATSWPGSFCQPGHVEWTDWIAGQSLVPLSDGECTNYMSSNPPSPSDFAARFMVVLVNPNAGDVGFTISANDALAALGGHPPGPPPRQRPREAAAAAAAHGRSGGAGRPMPGALLTGDPFAPAPAGSRPKLPPRSPPPADECVADVGPEDVGAEQRTFDLREDIDSPDRVTVGVNLQALGEHVAVWVDNETPIDFDSDCDDSGNMVETSPLPAFGFDNCDLAAVVEAFDTNIFPNVTGRFGLPSDVDMNCRVDILLSHRLNRLALTDSDPSNDRHLVRSFAEPEIDLWASDLVINPSSNEGETLYVFAPDPVGFWNAQTVPLDGYLDVQLAGQMTTALHRIVSYAAHVGVSEQLLEPGEPAGTPQDDWLDDAMGLLAADLCGFGAIAFRDAWIYLDRPHLVPLLAGNSLSDFEDRGGQYLFGRYIADVFGEEAISAIAASPESGIESVEAATGMAFDDLASSWAAAMAASGLQTPWGGQLVPDESVPNFQASTTVVVPDPPAPGDLVGAAGFQQGFDLHGINRTFVGGSDPSGPTELPDLLVLADNLDPLVYHPQADFFGSVAGGYGVAAVLVAGLEQPVNHLLIETEGGGDLLGLVFRIDDESPWERRLALEDVYGAKFTTARLLGDLPVEGQEVRLVGRIDPAEGLDLSVSPPADQPLAPLSVVPGLIEDTDRYAFSLSAATTVGVMVERRFSDTLGGASLADPFVAVVLASDLPDVFDYGQWDTGPAPSDGPCWDPVRYNYPIVVPDFIAAQGNLVADPTIDWTWQPVTTWTTALSSPPTPPFPCSIDMDQDEIPDADEAFPSTLHAQVLQRQAENLAWDPLFYEYPWALMTALVANPGVPFWGAAFVDADSVEMPDDDEATALPALGLGGLAVAGGEEAVWTGTLPPGDFVLVVGDAQGSAGPYDLSVRILSP